MVTEAQVWDALAQIPDPEIPVISLVDLGVVRGIDVDARRVRVEFTPTFLGCPTLEVMRDQMASQMLERLSRRFGSVQEEKMVDATGIEPVTPTMSKYSMGSS